MTTNDIQKQIAKLRRDKKVLWLGIMFFVMVVLWILSSIFTVTKTSSITPELRNLAKSFVPRLESNVFDEILAKRAFSVTDELYYFPIYIFDKTNLGDQSSLIDIITPGGGVVGTEDSTQVPSSEASQSGVADSPNLSPSSSPSPSSPQATESGNVSSGYLPIPIENIIGPSN